MIVVADATPLRYLILIEQAQILPALFGEVLIPSAVLAELSDTGTPDLVKEWIVNRPEWLKVCAPLVRPDAFPAALGAGEREAISLAEERNADVLLIDDWQARREAERRHLSIQGTLGVLGVAAEQGLLNLPEVIDRLRQTNFRASEKLLRAVFVR